jgi:hypothetical protein
MVEPYCKALAVQAPSKIREKIKEMNSVFRPSTLFTKENDQILQEEAAKKENIDWVQIAN